MSENEILYITDADGQEVGVIVPIEIWREIASERETAYLLSNPVMRKRLLGALNRSEGCISLDDARAKLGI
ncbi:MAG: prevent-host-death protein [Candidatus Hydrogenedentes bacterium]|nr:prevent-host-death protein [Candidatus Hydrogenedentota bacterium]